MPSPTREFDFIREIRGRGPASPQTLIGIGDDAALVQSLRNGEFLVTTDMLMEGTDFTFPPATPEMAGRKTLAVNLSDIAAMAGRPVAVFVSLALPKSRGGEFARQFQMGLSALAEEYHVDIAGGDTNSWDGPLVANVTLLGEPTGSGPVTRSGARPGDSIFVTGACGGSIHGRHLTFTPRIAEALALHSHVRLTSMIDISDGLAADLHHLLDESRVGAELDAAAIPIHPDAIPTTEKSSRERALGDGEDFELLFTVSEADAEKLVRDSPTATPLTRIGRITADSRAFLITPDGKKSPLPRLGWQHLLS